MRVVVERPILFSAPMVRAILEGRKTVTRRPVKGDQIPHLTDAQDDKPWVAVGQHDPRFRRYGYVVSGASEEACAAELGEMGVCPHGAPGNQLWVRETLERANGEAIGYPADGTWLPNDMWRWSRPLLPSIFCPRDLSRIQLEITGVRVERLQAMMEADFVAEGCAGGHDVIPGYAYCATPREHFKHVWDETGGDWDANPWVWVIDFRRVEVSV